nr:winged helix DNA-binding domain-containing protein [Actinomycetota bacterium]
MKDGGMTERTLTERELNRALLARQLLLERSDLSLNKALERIGGLQTQYAPSAYIGLWSRLRDFRKETLTQALEKRRIVQATMMRITIHMATVPDYKLFSAGTRKSRRKVWLSYHRRHAGDLDMPAVARSVRKHLADGPRNQAELVELLESDGFPRIAWSGAGLWVDLVRVPPSGTWAKRRADLYGLAADWIGPYQEDERAGIEHLARRYLSGFGPAPVTDIANWAGLQVTALRPVMAEMKLRRFKDAKGGELVDLPRALLPDAD